VEIGMWCRCTSRALPTITHPPPSLRESFLPALDQTSRNRVMLSLYGFRSHILPHHLLLTANRHESQLVTTINFQGLDGWEENFKVRTKRHRAH
jgi:hypothetical protein